MKNIRHKPKWRFAGFILAIVTMFGLIVAVQPASADSPQAVPSVNNYTPKGGGECTEPVTQFEYAKFFSYSNDRNTAEPYHNSYPPQWVDQDYGAWLPDDYVISSGVPATGQIAGGYYWYGKTGNTKVIQVPVECPPETTDPVVTVGATLDCAGELEGTLSIDVGSYQGSSGFWVVLDQGGNVVKQMDIPAADGNRVINLAASGLDPTQIHQVGHQVNFSGGVGEPTSRAGNTQVIGPEEGCEPDAVLPDVALSGCKNLADGIVEWSLSVTGGQGYESVTGEVFWAVGDVESSERDSVSGSLSVNASGTLAIGDNPPSGTWLLLGYLQYEDGQEQFPLAPLPDCEPTEGPSFFSDCVDGQWVITAVVGPIIIDGPNDQVTLQTGESHTMVGGFAELYGPTHRVEDFLGRFDRPADCEPTEECPEGSSPNMFGECVPDPVIPEVGVSRDCYTITVTSEEEIDYIDLDFYDTLPDPNARIFVGEGRTSYTFEVDPDGPELIGVWIKSADNGGDGLPGAGEYVSVDPAGDGCEPPEECPEGQELVGDKCVAECPEGSSRDDKGNCVQTGTPPDPETCPEGYVMSGGACIKEVKPEKPAPTTTTTAAPTTTVSKQLPRTGSDDTSSMLGVATLVVIAGIGILLVVRRRPNDAV